MSREDFRNASGADPIDSEFLELVAKARAGCDQSIGKLFDECRPYLLAIAGAELDTKVAAKVGASDLVQNSILSAQRCMDEFAGESRDELLAWLRGFLLNDLKQTHRHYRAEKRNIDSEQPLRHDSIVSEASRFVDHVDSPSTAASMREQEERLYRSLQALGDEDRLVIELRNWQRLSFSEIGVRTNRSADAARKSWSRAIARLQKQMESDDGDG